MKNHFAGGQNYFNKFYLKPIEFYLLLWLLFSTFTIIASESKSFIYTSIFVFCFDTHSHNYTGNQLTLRDWFQLSLKEGLTVFRNQEFSSELNDREV